MKRKILITALFIVAVAGAIGIYQWNKPKRTANDEKPAAILTADDIFSQFSTDEKATNAAYLNKVILVKGRVINTEKNASEFTVYLETSDVLGMVSCAFIPGTEAVLAKGTEVSIKGICTGYLTDVVLTQCALVQ